MRRLKFMRQGPLALAPSALGVEFGATEARGFDRKCDDVAVVEICGPLSHRQEWFFDSYEAIEARAVAAFASDCKAVVLSIDSPGGDVSGCFELARALRRMAQSSGKQFIAFVDGQASSAGYALAAACNEICLPPTASVGSIGVISALVDQTSLDKNAGINFAIVSSGARKADGNPHVPITDEAIAECQAQVDYLAGLFFEWVSEARGMSSDAVRDLQAASFHGARAVAQKLADRVCTFNELIASLASETETKATAAAEDPMDKEKLKAALAKMAEGDDEDAKWAKKMLGAEDDKEDEKASDEDKDDEKASDEDKDDAKAESESDDKKDDDKKEDAKALAAKALAVSQETARKLAKREESEERGRLLASRPDFPAEVVATLEKASVSVVRDAVKSYPKFTKLNQNAAAIAGATSTALATRGEGQADGRADRQSKDDALKMDERMGLRPRMSAIRHDRVHSVFGAMTAEEAKARLEAGEKKDGVK